MKERRESVTRRLFAGIALDDGAREGCAAASARLRATGIAASFEDPDKFHLTLAFLGNVADERCSEIVAALRQAAIAHASFGIVLDRLGAFPHERKPRIVYAGARRQDAKFRVLAAAVRDAYRRCGFEFSDDAIAHVTLARTKDALRTLPLVEIAPVAVACTNLTLFESTFDKEKNTSHYEVFFEEPLRRVSGA
jgi:2'-5' RNA ligase